ncbi:MAG: hypothetical protein IKU95_03710, partial [Clostridia bacterium]|nr:hypothetical protein [Clostridia bacterium]
KSRYNRSDLIENGTDNQRRKQAQRHCAECVEKIAFAQPRKPRRFLHEDRSFYSKILFIVAGVLSPVKQYSTDRLVMEEEKTKNMTGFAYGFLMLYDI